MERCAALTPPDSGAINTTVAIFGTIVEVLCDIGYKIKGNATRRIFLECLENRSWNASAPVCEGASSSLMVSWFHRSYECRLARKSGLYRNEMKTPTDDSDLYAVYT